ncbi:MAG: DUF971 domain-containing protein [Planctomycetaceae bacterium]|jgi:DUF971 family protein|nr:DUF971 domain-containing protein [Planctomycetaceae bacterium]
MTPSAINRLDGASKLEVKWPDEVTSTLLYRDLRLACGCAHCVDEWTGKPLLNPADVTADVCIEKISLVGNYAIRIAWNDGHDTGLTTWKRLAELTRGDTTSA